MASTTKHTTTTRKLDAFIFDPEGAPGQSLKAQLVRSGDRVTGKLQIDGTTERISAGPDHPAYSYLVKLFDLFDA